MSELRWVITAVSLALATACAPPHDPLGARTRAGIVGGTATTGDPAVFLLEIRSNTNIESMCTATLIGPRSLLTAAHCVDPAMIGGTQLTLTATNAPTRAQADAGASLRVVETRFHPAWNPAAGLMNDLALLRLEVDAGVAPVPWSEESLAGLGGAPVRAVGYGADGPDAGLGIRRTVDLEIRQLSAGLISLGDLVGKGICHGDSGGPTFHTFPDGVERVIGVHSFTRSDTCVDGADTRLDVNAAFLLQWLSDREDTCGADGVCSLVACATPDADCQPLGAACRNAFECQGRLCAGDPQHPEPFCSKPCSSSAECGPALECDGARCRKPQLPTVANGEACTDGVTACEGDALCLATADDAQPRCWQPCSPTRSCVPGWQCEATPSGVAVCLAPPPLRVPIARIQGPAAGCAQVSFTPLVILSALWVRRRLRAAPGRGNC